MNIAETYAYLFRARRNLWALPAGIRTRFYPVHCARRPSSVCRIWITARERFWIILGRKNRSGDINA